MRECSQPSPNGLCDLLRRFQDRYEAKAKTRLAMTSIGRESSLLSITRGNWDIGST